MPYTRYLRCCAIAFSLLALSSSLTAQNPAAPQWSQQGATVVSVRSSATLSVRGSFVNDRASTLYNDATVYVTGDWTNNVPTPIVSTPNNAGTVRLTGDEQTIRGSQPTNFYDLHLQNTGTKHARQHVGVWGTLYLNDRELEAAQYTISVENPSLAAVQTGFNGAFGFVSNLDTGALQRATNQSADYLFPVGSALAPARLRPVRLRPEDAAINAYKVRFANVDATAESYDRSLRAWEVCDINPLYYHRIARPTGASAATAEILFDATADGANFTGLAQWQVGSLWGEAALFALPAAPDAVFTNLSALRTDIALNSFTPTPFALAQLAPALSLAVAPTPLCANSQILLTASGDYNTFDFYIDGQLRQSSADSTYSQNGIAQGAHTFYASAAFNAQCGRRSDTFNINVLPPLIAAAANDTFITTGSDARLYTTGAGDFFLWQPETLVDCPTCPATLSRPQETTNYVVTIENIDGCIVVDTMTVFVRDNVADFLFIPNVLTPNSDGKNDTWFIRNIEIFPRNKVIILNRWGDRVFASEFYNNDWDGSFAGGLLPAGTYYYIIDLGDGWGVFKGDVTIIR